MGYTLWAMSDVMSCKTEAEMWSRRSEEAQAERSWCVMNKTSVFTWDVLSGSITVDDFWMQRNMTVNSGDGKDEDGKVDEEVDWREDVDERDTPAKTDEAGEYDRDEQGQEVASKKKKLE